MKTIATASAFVMVVLLASEARPQAPNAAEILRSCATAPDAPTELCKSFVNGIMDGITVDQVARERGDPICLPEGLRTEEMIAAIALFIAQHQNFWTLRGDAVIGVALQNAFPCKR